ncbi:MAG: ABC transporter ATP-binding protein, partial [Novosphingobium sp.]
RLVLVDNGTAKDYDGSMENYIDFVLGRNQPKGEGKVKGPKLDKKAAAKARDDLRLLKNKVTTTEAAMVQLQAQMTLIDHAMFDPSSASPELATLTMSELSRRRSAVADDLASAEAEWIEAGEALDSLMT